MYGGHATRWRRVDSGLVGRILTGWFLVRHRMRAHWRLLLASGLGVLLAATLLGAVPTYSDAMADLGLRFRLDRGLPDPRQRILYLDIDNSTLGDPADAQRRAALDTVTGARIGWLGDGLVTEDRSQRLTARLEQPNAEAWPAFVAGVSHLADYVEVTEGRMPAEGATVEVVLPEGYQRFARLGDTIRLTLPPVDDCPRIPGSDDAATAAAEVRCRPTTVATASTAATVVGFVRQRNPADLRWQIVDGEWAVPRKPGLDNPDNPDRPQPGAGGWWLLTTAEQYRGTLAQRLPELRSRHRVGLVPDLREVGVREVTDALASIQAWQDDARVTLGLSAHGVTSFADQLAVYRNAQTFSRVPLLIILLQIVGVIGFYIVLIASMLAERRGAELSVYRSRGASVGQLVGLALFEGLLLAVPAAVAAPWLAGRVVALLGHASLFERTTGGADLPVSVGPEAYLLAAAGAAFSVLAMAIPAWAAARRGVIDDQRERARPRRRGFAQRYYLDVALVALAGLQWWQLERSGTALDPKSLGGWSSDPLLLSFPLVAMLAITAIVLRTYAPLLRLAVRLSQPLRGVAVAVGLRQTSRSPATHARLLMLLVMATSVATFAASYGPTVGRSFRERVQYEAGVDLRARVREPGPRMQQPLEDVRALPGVAEATFAYRGNLRAGSGGEVTVLGIDDGARVGPMLWTRPDFASEPVPALLERIRPPAEGSAGIALPETAVAIQAQLFLDLQGRLPGIAARLRDATGEYFDARFEEITPSEWRQMTAAIPVGAVRPVSLVAFRMESSLFVRREGSLYFDDLASIDAQGRATALYDFELPAGWTAYTQAGIQETFALSNTRARSKAQSGRWSWTAGPPSRESVVAVGGPATLAGLFSTSALKQFGLREGDLTTMTLPNGVQVPLRVAGVLNLFPTLDPGSGFIVADRRQLRAISGTASTSGPFANELWVDFDASLPLADQQAVTAQLERRFTSPVWIAEPLLQAAMVEEADADPTLVASGSGILLVAAAAVLILAAAGFVVTAVIAVGARRTEFAVLRALGITPRQILWSLLLEWSVLAVLGVVLGVVLGRQIAGVMLSSLSVTPAGTRVVPPFIVESDWLSISAGTAVVVALAAIALVLAWRAVARRANAEVLRQTQ